MTSANRLLLLGVASCLGANALMSKTQINSVEEFQDEYVWIFVLAIFFAFFMAWGIGANDVANSFASSVGSKALTLKQAVMIATVVEFVGCVTMGASVTDTVRKGIIDGAYFEENPEVLMLGMLSALLGAGLWLCLCSFLGSPVSTTHSIIGSLVGVSLTTNPNSLNGMQIFLVVISWFVSPICSGILAAGMFLVVRTLILRSDDAIARGLKFFPLLLFFTFLIVSMYTVFKNPQVNLKAWRDNNPGPAVGVAFALAFLLASCTYAATIQRLKANIDATSDIPPDAEKVSVVPADKPEGGAEEKVQTKSWGWNKDLEAEAAKEDANVAALGDAEVFPPKTEKLFSFLQVICASFGALAHGANDCANAVGPLAAIIGIYEEGKISDKVEVPIWILVLGGVGISVGLLTYGYNVIKAIGMKLVKVTPSRGFAIEIGAFLVVIIGTNLGIPLSTTHCKVGATVAVGMCEAKGLSTTKKGVNWRLMGKVASMWVLTLAFASIISSSMYAVMVAAFHPMAAPLSCGLVQNKLARANYVLDYSAADMENKFAQLDTNADKLLDSAELASNCPPLNMLRNSEDLTVEKYGRRRRRIPEDMTKEDFLQYTCMSADKLDHMENTKCEPQCMENYVADDALKCNLDGNSETEDGGFILRTVYSGFDHCVPHHREC